MTPKLLQLYSLRAQVDAIIALEESEMGAAVLAAGCPHPEEKRIPTTTFGSEPEFYCPVCREKVKGQA